MRTSAGGGRCVASVRCPSYFEGVVIIARPKETGSWQREETGLRATQKVSQAAGDRGAWRREPAPDRLRPVRGSAPLCVRTDPRDRHPDSAGRRSRARSALGLVARPRRDGAWCHGRWCAVAGARTKSRGAPLRCGRGRPVELRGRNQPDRPGRWVRVCATRATRSPPGRDGCASLRIEGEVTPARHCRPPHCVTVSSSCSRLWHWLERGVILWAAARRQAASEQVGSRPTCQQKWQQSR
jgi:hypothetical protein